MDFFAFAYFMDHNKHFGVTFLRIGALQEVPQATYTYTSQLQLTWRLLALEVMSQSGGMWWSHNNNNCRQVVFELPKQKTTVQDEISFHKVVRLEPELYSDAKGEGVISTVMFLRYDVLRVS